MLDRGGVTSRAPVEYGTATPAYITKCIPQRAPVMRGQQPSHGHSPRAPKSCAEKRARHRWCRFRGTPKLQRGFCGQRQARVLVHDLRRRARGELFFTHAAHDNPSPSEVTTFRPGRTTRAQDPDSLRPCQRTEGQADAAFFARLCARSES